MNNTLIALYNWTNGVVMIVIFAVVCITLVGILVNFMTKEKNKESSQDSNENDK